MTLATQREKQSREFADAVALSINDAHKEFGGTTALAGASLQLERGKLLALLGPNGAGKTTLIRAITGRVHLDAGSITFLGKTLLPGDPREKIGVVPQNLALYPILTATENLEAFASLHGLPAKQQAHAVNKALDWTGLSERATEPISEFSEGMKRRLNIACGLLHDPTLIVLDEPTVGVDPQSRERIWNVVKNLQDLGTTVLLTTHQIDEAEQLSDKIVIIDRGVNIAEGTAPDIIDQIEGTTRKVTLYLESEAPIIQGFEQVEHGVLTCAVDDIAIELPLKLQEIAAAKCVVRDLTVQSPSLQSAFLKLTGRELRD